MTAQEVIGRRGITPDDLAQFGVQVVPDLPFRVVTRVEPDYVNPYAQQASFEVERAVGNLTVSAAYNFNRALHLPRSRDHNLFLAGETETGLPQFGFVNPLLLQDNVYEAAANSFYHALILQTRRRFGRHYSFNAHYTWSKAIDEVTDFNTDFQPHNQLDARAGRALSPFHQAHRFVVSAVIESPWAAGRREKLRDKLLGDFMVSPVVIASSSRPFNVLAGFDNLNDRHSTTHRPHGAGRNIGIGPSFATFDLRISRKFPWGSERKRSVEFIAEVFNLMNHTNFRSLNNVVGDLGVDDLPKPLVGRSGNPTEPLSFSSAFNPRQFQFGLKIHY